MQPYLMGPALAAWVGVGGTGWVVMGGRRTGWVGGDGRQEDWVGGW